jgi:hypothetical protein
MFRELVSTFNGLDAQAVGNVAQLAGGFSYMQALARQM